MFPCLTKFPSRSQAGSQVSIQESRRDLLIQEPEAVASCSSPLSRAPSPGVVAACCTLRPADSAPSDDDVPFDAAASDADGPRSSLHIAPSPERHDEEPSHEVPTPCILPTAPPPTTRPPDRAAHATSPTTTLTSMRLPPTPLPALRTAAARRSCSPGCVAPCSLIWNRSRFMVRQATRHTTSLQ